MEIPRDRNLQPPRSRLLGFITLLALTIALIVASWLQNAVPLIQLYRDTFVLAAVPSYFGIASNLGAFLFCMAGSIACFSALILAADERDREFAKFLLTFGGISFMLLADDFLLFHEIMERRFGVREKLVFLSYAAIICASLVRFRAVVLATPYGYLLLSLSFFALSVVFDRILDGTEDMVLLFKPGEKYLLEDGSKLLGISSWLFYFALCSHDRISGSRPRAG